MADIRPFRSIRPQREKAADMAVRPYDVFSRKEATAFVQENPSSFLKIVRPETQFPISVDMYDEKVYEKARELLLNWEKDGTLMQDDKNCYYIYELTMQGRVQTGIVACASVDDYKKHIIKRHENTREEKEADRVRHVEACQAQTGPIYLTYRTDETIRAVTEEVKLGEAEYDFVAEGGVRHRVFVIREEAQIEAISEAFAKIDKIYIADGHHRAASAVRVCEKCREKNPAYTGEEEYNYFLSVLFPSDELTIMDYNRVVKDLNGYSFKGFLREVCKRFWVEEITGCEDTRPKERGAFSMYMEGHWFMCRIREEDRNPENAVEDLDVSILQKLLLEPVLGIRNPRTNGRIDFVGGICGMEELVRRCEDDCAVAFAMYPTAIDDLFAVADEGKLMPPKSTWFEPKLRSGLFIHSIEEEAGEK